MNIANCETFVELDENRSVESHATSTRLTKQRTDAWFEARKLASVTGSTFYKATGLDGMQKLKEHFDQVICSIPQKDNEPNAMATFVGKILPVLYLGKCAFEEGYISMEVSNNNPFLIVSPDGSVRSSTDLESTVAGLELKCPLKEVHKQMPERYLLQCLSEIEALNVEELVYLTWQPDISSVFKVRRNLPLFQKSLDLAKCIYGGPSPKRPSKCLEETRSLKESVKYEVTCGDNIELVGVVKSLRNSSHAEEGNRAELFRVNRVAMMLEDIVAALHRYHELNRTPATEAVVFRCCDLDREWKEGTVRSGPICWFPKGYSLDTKTARGILETVLDNCHQNNIHVPAISFDGQWHNICVRDSAGNPLTLLQLQKDVWRKVENMSKAAILKELRALNKDTHWKKETTTHGDDKMVVIRTDQEIKNLPRVSQSVTDQRKRELKRKDSNRQQGT